MALKTNNPSPTLIFTLKSRLLSLSKRLKRHNLRSDRKVLTSLTRTSVFSIVKRRLKSPSSIPSLIVNSQVISNDSGKAASFSSSFSNNFNATHPPISPAIPQSCQYHPDPDLFAPWVIESVLSKLPPRCGFSPHPANYYIIKKCCTSLAHPLSIIFQESYSKSIVPCSWKHAVVIPILKKGSPSSPQNFRPISLTDPFARIFERILCNRIKSVHSHKFSPFQNGFLAYRSCTNALIYSISRFKSILAHHKTLDVVYFDFSKAFDQVPHSLLLAKLANFGIDPLSIAWFQDFLTNRTFSVKVNDYIEPSSHPIPSGVPQGSVAGPLLFIIFINDLLLSFPPTLYFSCFADDIKIFSHNPSSVQLGIDHIVAWSKINLLPLAPAKTSLLRLGSNNLSHPYIIDNLPIVASSPIRDLGLLTDQHLTFSAHIHKISALALLRCKQLLKSFNSKSPKFYLALFNCYVMPLLDYCSVIFSPTPNSKLSRKLELPLRMFSKTILQRCNIPFSSTPGYSYLSRLQILECVSIRHRRLKAQLLLLYKFVNYSTYIPHPHSYFRLSSSLRRPMTLICINPHVKDFFSSSIPLWNAITSNVTKFLTPSQFEALLDSSISRY